MTWESQARCRYFPRCMIHTGDPKPRLLSPEVVNEIRDYISQGMTTSQIAKEIGVGKNVITNIKFGRTYREVPSNETGTVSSS